MANECSFCGQRHIETNMLVLGGDWLEFCQPCGERETVRNAETGEEIPVAALFRRIQRENRDEHLRQQYIAEGLIKPAA